jgi:N-acetylglutamate synthase-like GNAT family acetyltransferase
VVGVLAVAVIRPARAADVEWIVTGRELLRCAIEEGGCSVFERDGRVLGCVGLDHAFYANGFVSVLLVREDARRQGIGEALMRHAMSSCRTPKLFTSTNLSNVPMQQLLAKLGFELSGVIHDLDPGDPELVYYLDRARG